MSWAEVKKINSDMSIPIDKLLLSLRQFAPSNDTLISFNRVGISQTETIDMGNFKSALHGMLRLEYELRSQEWKNILSIHLYENGEEIYSDEIEDDEKTGYYDFKVKRNAIYEIKIKQTSETTNTNPFDSIASAYICGKVSDIGFIDYNIY